jgi:hypothetical protein
LLGRRAAYRAAGATVRARASGMAEGPLLPRTQLSAARNAAGQQATRTDVSVIPVLRHRQRAMLLIRPHSGSISELDPGLICAYKRAQVQLSARWGRAQEPGDLGPPEQPMVLQRALELLSSRLGIDPARLADEERLPLDTLTSLLADVVSDDALKPVVPVG